MPTSVWYQITDDSYPHCHQPMCLLSRLDLTEDRAWDLAHSLREELLYILSLSEGQVKTWVE